MHANRTKSSLTKTKKFVNHVFLLEQLKNYECGRNLTQKLLRGQTTWKDMLRNALRDSANWRLNQLENYLKYALKLS